MLSRQTNSQRPQSSLSAKPVKEPSPSGRPAAVLKPVDDHCVGSAYRQPVPIAESISILRLGILKRLPGVLDLTDVKILNFGHRERLADFCHPLLPLTLANHCNLFDLAAMRCREFCIVPQSVHVPTVKIMEPYEHF